MNYEYYKIFYHVGKQKNITRAAAELYSSQPAVTRAIQKLEAELGCPLFIRTKSGVEFTHEGQKLYDYVKIACQQLTKAEEEIGQSSVLQGSTIYIGATVTALHCFLFGFLDTFHEKYPEVKFKIKTGSSDAVIGNLKDGEVDLAFVTTPCPASKGLRMTTIRSFGDILIAGRRFEELRNRTLTYEDLRSYPFICLLKDMQLRRFIDDMFAAHRVNITPDIESDSADLIVPMVSHNLGLAFVPEGFTQDALQQGDIFQVKFASPLPQRFVCLITDPSHPQTSASHAFATLVEKACPN